MFGILLFILSLVLGPIYASIDEWVLVPTSKNDKCEGKLFKLKPIEKEEKAEFIKSCCPPCPPCPPCPKKCPKPKKCIKPTPKKVCKPIRYCPPVYIAPPPVKKCVRKICWPFFVGLQTGYMRGCQMITHDATFKFCPIRHPGTQPFSGKDAICSSHNAGFAGINLGVCHRLSKSALFHHEVGYRYGFGKATATSECVIGGTPQNDPATQAAAQGAVGALGVIPKAFPIHFSPREFTIKKDHTIHYSARLYYDCPALKPYIGASIHYTKFKVKETDLLSNGKTKERVNESMWRFGFAPEAGVRFSLNKLAHLRFGVAYEMYKPINVSYHTATQNRRANFSTNNDVNIKPRYLTVSMALEIGC